VRVLGGDIGGTKTVLRAVELGPGGERPLAHRRYDSRAYAEFEPLVADFLRVEGIGTPEAACFGVAGPVSGRRATTTNLPWTLDAARLEANLGIPRIRLINDFQAVGYGIERLAQSDLAILQAGQEVALAPRALIGAGTGLGQALMVWAGTHYEVLASEGGHVDFGPTDELQVALLHFLRARHGRASYERILSGPGLVAVYEFLRSRAGRGPDPGRSALDPASGDPAAAISHAAAAGRDPLAAQALDLFVRVYGAQAGNLALTALATGGVYVAGGIAPQILAALRQGGFLAAFRDKGRMRALAERMPVRVVMNREVGVLGAVAVAARLAADGA